jgi:D-amino-acid oxidase
LWRDVVSGFEVLDLGDTANTEMRAPPGAVFGVKYQTVCFNAPVCLKYLLDTVKGLGARVIKAELQVKDGLKGVIRDAKTVLIKDKM